MRLNRPSVSSERVVELFADARGEECEPLEQPLHVRVAVPYGVDVEELCAVGMGLAIPSPIRRDTEVPLHSICQSSATPFSSRGQSKSCPGS